MPAVSESQQRLFGMVHAYQKGKLKNPPKKVKEVAEHISEEDAEHFAKTKHKGLPERKEKKAADRLYTYLPKDNTAPKDGILSTVLTDNGFKHYRTRTGKYKKEDVLKVLDSWEPDWTRSKAISALAMPIPEDAAPDLREFADTKELYSFDLKDLIKAGILVHLRHTKKKRGTYPVEGIDENDKYNWKRKPFPLRFKGIPHYMVETKDGKIPPELIRHEKKASTRRKEAYESAEEMAADLRKRLKYGIRYSDGTYETSPDMWDRRDARDIVVQTPEELDESGIGMCHDVTQALIRKLRENRIRGTAVMLKGNHEPDLPTHSFVVTKRDGKYTVLDPLSYDSGHKGGYRSMDDAISDRIEDWKKEDEKGDVVSSRIRPRDWKRRGLLDFLRYGHEKKAQAFSQDGKTVTLSRGQTPSHVVRAYNKAHPNSKITVPQFLKANNNLAATRFRAGKAYNMPTTTPATAVPAKTVAAPVRPAVPAAKPVPTVPAAPVKPVAAPVAGPLGFRQHNPGNLRSDGKTLWQGASGVPAAGKFLTFKDPYSGVRAMSRVIRNYGKLHKIDTLRGVVNRYAPAVENNQKAYMSAVSKSTGFKPDDKINLTNEATLQKLVPAMGSYEIGPRYFSTYNPSLVSNAVSRAVSGR